MTLEALSKTSRDAFRNRVQSFVDTKQLLGFRYNDFVYGSPSIEDANAVQGQAANEFGQAHHFTSVLKRLDAPVADLERRESPADYYSMDVLDESPNTWPGFLATVGFADLATQVRLQSFAGSNWESMADPAAKALQEEEFHTQYLIGAIESSVRLDAAATETFRATLTDVLPAVLRWFGSESDAATRLAEHGVLDNTPDTERTLYAARIGRVDTEHFDGEVTLEAIVQDAVIDWNDWDDERARTSGGPKQAVVDALSTHGIESSIKGHVE